jgi:1-deoxy-D-xylulose-5-phosphate reductoisomerase
VLNAANEVAVASFLAGEIGFLGIPEVVEASLARLGDHECAALADVFALDTEARAVAQSAVAALR